MLVMEIKKVSFTVPYSMQLADVVNWKVCNEMSAFSGYLQPW